MFGFFKRKKKKEKPKIEYLPWLQVNYIFKEYIDGEDTEEIRQIDKDIFSFDIVDRGGPMSLEEAILYNYPIPPSLDNTKFPIFYVFDEYWESDIPPQPIFISNNKDKVIKFLEEYKSKLENS